MRFYIKIIAWCKRLGIYVKISFTQSMPLWKKYHIARSLEEALQVMTAAPGACRTIAGGTDLLLDLQQGRLPPVDTLVDVTAIPELTCLEMRESGLFIGAAVPLSEIAASRLVKQQACALADACDLIGGPQVRNVATLGGGVMMGLGNALIEAFIVEEGKVFTDRMARYRIPSILHTPDITSIIVEHPTADGPFGAKGVGEIVSIPTTPAITNAIYHAVGVRIDYLPSTRSSYAYHQC